MRQCIIVAFLKSEKEFRSVDHGTSDTTVWPDVAYIPSKREALKGLVS